ncbi:hypothetical protein MS3_00002923 [Schistosoma haematobium]|uniref:Protein F37C4.5 n=1 Tax=Schistosoma haematobium TaxID=6185 RepID=A0A094ZF95_SCHHA|nr:hypothetical protein MS3_00002923 [Schistosoma haematobium]KAH9590107.1 hypothetical protein MS3_00002923 [Schistosoma haematobium]CAH8650602.1 unnamed protein product [Schistosoma haematobium]
MSTTVGVSDITADQSELNRESYISYPSYDIDNTPAQSSFGHLNHMNHGEYQNRLNGGEDEYLPGDIKENISGNNNSNEDIPMNDDRSEYTNMKTEESYHDSTCPSHSEQELDQDILKNEHGKNELVAEQNMECLNIQNVENQQKLSFNQIKEDLEKKNVIGSLQPLRPEQYIMHHQAGLIKQQEMLILNPQTSDVLSDQYSSHHQTNTITTGGTHHFARNIASNNSVVVPTGGNVSGPPVGSGTVAGQQKGSTVYPKTGQNPIDGGTNGGVGANSSGNAGGGPGKSGALVGGGLDRSRQVYNMFECQMSQLTVFLDRALICRRIRPRFNASDITEVVFEHLSPAIDKDSIRVEIRGAATILDVSFSAKSLSGEEDTWSQCVNELLVELRQCRRRADNLVNRIIRTEKQRCVLETFADSLSRREDEILLGGNHHGHVTLNNLPNHTGVADQVNNIPSQGATLSGGTTPANAQMAATTAEHKCINDIINPYDPRNVETLHKFLEIYKDEAERFDTVLMDTTEELEQVRTQIETLEKEVRDIELKQDEHLARELSVLVEPRETGQVEMLVSYVVNRCGWKPAYDIRIFNNDGTMKIVYYGMVQQATGEDWETRYMTLSTAQPGIGGTVPHLGVQRVHFRRDVSPDSSRQLQSIDKSNLNEKTSRLPSAGTIPSYSKRISANAAVFYQTPPLQRSDFTRGLNDTISYEMTDRLSAYYDNSTEYCSTLGRSDSMASTTLHSSLGRRNKLHPRSKSRETIRTITQRDGITPSGTLQRGGSIESTYATGLRSSSTRPINRRTLGSSMLFNSVTSQSPLLSNRISTLMNSQPATLPTSQQSAPPVGTVATIQLEVPRPPAIIRCDNEPNRVTVGLLDLQPRYEYVTVPKRSLYAYLKATAVNNTEFSILAGPTNIYADNTFIGKSEIRAVAPGEEFNCHLGAENGIKILYRPLFKYREGTGSSGKNATMTFKQLIEVRNTFDRRVRLMVVDQVPVSAEDKIKVSLLEPTIKHPEKYDKNRPIRMNKFNNVEWDLDLGPGEIRELTLKYSVEHPINEDLDVSVSEN